MPPPLPSFVRSWNLLTGKIKDFNPVYDKFQLPKTVSTLDKLIRCKFVRKLPVMNQFIPSSFNSVFESRGHSPQHLLTPGISCNPGTAKCKSQNVERGDS